MLRIKTIIVVSFVFLLITSGPLHSQTKPFIFFDIRPSADHTVLIQWHMPPEVNTLPFQVERSRDNSTWERIASVSAHLSHQYSYKDLHPEKG